MEDPLNTRRRGGSTRWIKGESITPVPSMPEPHEADRTDPKQKWRFFVYSAIGSFAFFVPFTVGEKNTILLDHIVGWLQEGLSACLLYTSPSPRD